MQLCCRFLQRSYLSCEHRLVQESREEVEGAVAEVEEVRAVTLTVVPASISS